MTAGGRLIYTLHLWPPVAHAKHYTGSALQRQLARRLADHALGRGARLPQVQVERGGSWVLAQTEPGGHDKERQLKKHGAARRCEVCKAVESYQAGQLTASDALTRAGWDRASQHERGLLLDIFGIGQVPQPAPAQPPGAPRPDRSASPPAPAAVEARDIPAPRPAPRAQYITPEFVALVDQLETRWAAEREAAQAAAVSQQPEAGA